jgi:hypothetical protein
MEVYRYALTSALDACKYPASRPGYFTAQHTLGGLQTGLDVLGKRSIAPAANQALGRPARSTVTTLTELPQLSRTE